MRTKLSSKSTVFVAMTVAGALLSFAAPVFATGVPGYAGKNTTQLPTTNLTTVQCMTSSSNGAVTNNCGMNEDYMIPLPSNQGSHQVTVSTHNPGGGTFKCTVDATDNVGTVLASSQTWFPSTGDTQFNLNVTTQAQGSMYLLCTVNSGGKIYNVNYNE